MKNDSGSRALGFKWKINDSGSYMRKMTLGRELWALNGKDMTPGHK